SPPRRTGRIPGQRPGARRECSSPSPGAYMRRSRGWPRPGKRRPPETSSSGRWSPAWGWSHTRSRCSTGLDRCSLVPLIIGPARIDLGGFGVGLDLLQVFRLGRQQRGFPALGHQLLRGGVPGADSFTGHRGYPHSLPPPCGGSCESHGTPAREHATGPRGDPRGPALGGSVVERGPENLAGLATVAAVHIPLDRLALPVAPNQVLGVLHSVLLQAVLGGHANRDDLDHLDHGW